MKKYGLWHHLRRDRPGSREKNGMLLGVFEDREEDETLKRKSFKTPRKQARCIHLRKLVPESQIRKMDEPADGLYSVSVWVIKFSKFCSTKNHNMLPTLWFTFLNRDDTLGTLIVQKSFSALVFHRLPRRHFHQRRWAQEKGSDPTGVGDHPARPGTAKA